ncbi:MAG: VCBS repeat-containing protein [Candidatus Marinimicrobia bacterium]|nr:VCBS repeat-containing protein [Candidatus Neomarinimicrobiota bacterium]
MKKTVIIFTCLTAYVFAGGFVQTGVAPGFIVGGDTLFGGVPYDAGRGISSGTDIDQDSKQEILITSYDNGGRITCFEESGTDTFAYVWASPNILDSDGSSTSYPRDVHVGDLDGDGKLEIITSVGRYPDVNPGNGIYIYEWDGSTDDGYGTQADLIVNLHAALNDSLHESRVEGFSVGDIDGDGKDEILLASNGGSNPIYGTVDGSPAYSEDRFIILGVTGDIGGFGAALVEEFAVSPRDVNKDGVRENALGGGSPQDIVMCDTDGDGLLEAACFSWNNLAMFFIEATGPNAYTLGDTAIITGLVDSSKAPFVKLANLDAWTLGAAVADMDGDGKDEVYVSAYDDNEIYVITDSDGDALSFDTTGTSGRTWVGNSEIAILGEGTSGVGAVAGFGVFAGGTAGVDDIKMYVLNAGGNVLNPADWTYTEYALPGATTGGVLKLNAGTDFDGDGNLEVVLPYKGLNDEVGGGLDPNGNHAFRVAEWDPSIVSVKDIVFIMPGDFKLAQNYPNPFNPKTAIEYTLPINKKLSLRIYNILGQEVITLVDNEYKHAGTHTVQWDGTDANGMKVSSGIYFYTLQFGNFSHTKQMTFMK